MNAKATKTLRAMLNADMPAGISPQHQAQMWTIIKRAYNGLNKNERHPDRLHAALAKAMSASAAKPTI